MHYTKVKRDALSKLADSTPQTRGRQPKAKRQRKKSRLTGSKQKVAAKGHLVRASILPQVGIVKINKDYSSIMATTDMVAAINK